MMFHIIRSSLSVMLLNYVCVDKGAVKILPCLREHFRVNLWVQKPSKRREVSTVGRIAHATSASSSWWHSANGLGFIWHSQVRTCGFFTKISRSFLQTGAKDPITGQMMKWLSAHSLIFLFLTICRTRTQEPSQSSHTAGGGFMKLLLVLCRAPVIASQGWERVCIYCWAG